MFSAKWSNSTYYLSLSTCQVQMCNPCPLHACFLLPVLLSNLSSSCTFSAGRALVSSSIFCMYGMSLKLGISNVTTGSFVFSWNVYIVKGSTGFKTGDRELSFSNSYKYKDIYKY